MALRAFGDTSLDGLRFAWLVSWPGAIHEGNGTRRTVVDESATPEQREAAEELVRGRQGGPYFEIFASVMSNDLDTALRGFTQNPTDPNTPDDVVRREGRALVNAEPTVRTHLSELNKLHPPSDARHDWGRYLDQLDTKVTDGDVISILPAVAGG